VEEISDGPDDHFSPSTYKDSVGGAHIIVGLIVMIVLVLQLVSGFVIDKMFDPKRVKTPFMDKLHWWAGRFVVLGGIVNAFLGVALYNTIFAAANVWYIVIAIWLVFVFAFFAVAQRTFGQTFD
jgi:hypothetical protein